MSDYLTECHKRHTNAIQSLGDIHLGDFVQIYGWTHWFEVVYGWEGQPATCLARYGNHGGHTFLHSIDMIHRKDDPWDHGEVQSIIDDKDWWGGKDKPPVPDKYKYHGTYRLKFWNYMYSGWVCTPRIQVAPLADFAAKAGVPLNNIPWNEFARVKQAIEEVRINRWRILVEPEPETIYGKTIRVREHIVY